MTGTTQDPRLAAAVAGWQRALLDLTKRNRALNFRPTRVSTVAVVDEQPAEIFRRLVLREQPMRFAAAPEPPNGSPAEPPADDVDVPAPEFTPYDPATLDARQTDEVLQTALVPEALDHSLRRLDEQARLAIEEQGVNTLFLALGMVHYTEAEASDVTLRAPLLLVPVELTRRSARAGYQLRVTDDDPLVNPALAEWLRRTHDVALPELPDVEALDETYDLQTWLAAVAATIDARDGWSLKNDVVLALFSFQKFVMYKDLERNAAPIASHRLVTQLVTRAGTTDDHVVGLPDDVRRMDLDAEFPPERTYQVVDADSSQLRAIAAVARGHDLVVEGPPGTGKSQTITNLIARALAAGQSVLFVAEKMAALSVVHSRLVAAGLGEFCLELHSTKANKRAVIRSLGAALDRSLESVTAVAGAAQRLPAVRATLDEYVDAVHTLHGALGATPFDAYGELAVVRDAPRVTYTGPIEGVSRALLDATVRDLADLGAAAAPIGVPAEHPWRDASRPLYTDDALHTIAALARDLAARLDRLVYDAGVLETSLGLPPVRTLADVDALVAIADVLRRSPGAPVAVLASDRWNAAPPEATSLVARGRAAVALRERLLARLAPEALERDHAEDVSYVRHRSEGILSFLAVLDGRWRGIRARWTQYRRPGVAMSMAEQAELMADVDRLRAERSALAAADGASLFGAAWRGEASDWDALDAYVRWVTELRALAVRHALAPRVLELAARGPVDVGAVLALRDAARDAVTVLERLRAEVGWPADYLGAAPIAEIAGRAAKLAEHVALGPRWAAYETARRAVERGLAAELLGEVTSGALPARDAAAAFRRAFWLRWLTAVVTLRPALERFSTLTHEQRVAEFRDLDRRVFRENQATLVAQLRERVQQRLREGEAARGMPLLRRELARQRGHAPLRKTLGEATAAVRAIKPCWMMSPLTVAQYLPGELPTFDLVIFDEASQLPVEDAVGAVIRGKQLVVVGDPKQLPPTNFFAASLVDDHEPADGMPAYEDAESILEEYMGAGVPMSRLRWHYRSAHESLIAFSNVQFYEGDLYTFPSVETDTETLGLRFQFVEGGTYEGKGLNMVEARAVADAVVAFARDQLARSARGERPLSLGVGTFNLRQQLAIQDELEQRRRADPSLEPFFDRGAAEPFFVKNLENIQGDERDVVFLSVTYARSADGRLRYNFGPLNGDNGWRRLNVITTRARAAACWCSRPCTATTSTRRRRRAARSCCASSCCTRSAAGWRASRRAAPPTRSRRSSATCCARSSTVG
ncbi:Protein of unknown function DUF4011 (plasmid) [Gemmatirosa kalamazoonensis]|uniref:DNA2/NAM7 helicase-like C-terminal domain-containing protein n=1 Tax=Gemmatirosa kalamazoonensis TaxID=861299 RepID=W0RSQ0_9BACT|nr:DUF4011 domain-containing protein [Gemmatirosa kalamazoonensis]AHG93502.1 Protein of unknown function DUF4011 [Gemmatirosa kalamazoonensis]